MKSLEKIFHYQNRNIRTVLKDCEPWFVAADVCGVLGLDTTQAVNGRKRGLSESGGLEDDEKGTDYVSTLGGRQKMLIVSEPGLYALVLKSRRPEARAFRRWITHEVIPALRRTGTYQMTESAIPKGKLLQFSRRDLLNLAIEAETECEELRGVVAELAPMAEFYDRVADTTYSFSLGETAKMLEIPSFGRNNLIKFLREEGILMADNVAKQRYVDRGYFRIVQTDYNVPDGTPRVKAVTRVYEKGGLYPASSGRISDEVYVRSNDAMSTENFTTHPRRNYMKICIDPGHSGPCEPGACAGGVTEAAIVLQVAQMLRKILEKEGHKVLLTREDDVEDDGLEWRVELAWKFKADIFISIHCNAAKESAPHGTEVFYYPGSERGRKLARCIQTALVENCHTTDRGIKTNDEWTVLTDTVCPAVLVELAFITNDDDRAELVDRTLKREFAVGIGHGVAEFAQTV